MLEAMGKVEKVKAIKNSRGTVIKAARIENHDPGHNKFYEIALEQMPDDTFLIRTFWGACGCAKPGTQIKAAQGSIVDALATFHDWIIEKRDKKNYQDIGTEPVWAKG